MDASMFKEAMSRFPSGVVVATTSDARGRAWGFTASSFSSVSLDPPLILVCLSKAAGSHQTFTSAQWFAISVLSADDEAAAATFSRRGVDKFAHASFDTDERGSPLLPSAVAMLTCQRFGVHDCGDHSVIVGRVTKTRLGSNSNPMVYAGRRFGRFTVDTRPAECALDAVADCAKRRSSANGRGR